MVKYQLKVSARLENVELLSLDEGPRTRFYMKIRCTNCGELSGKDTGSSVYFDNNLTPTGQGQEANYVAHCKFCRRLLTFTIVPKSYRPYVNEEDAEPQFTTMVEFDGRGGEPSDFEFHGSAWKVKVANSHSTFQDLEFTPPDKYGVDWCDFDDKTNQTVGIYNLQAKFQAI